MDQDEQEDENFHPRLHGAEHAEGAKEDPSVNEVTSAQGGGDVPVTQTFDAERQRLRKEAEAAEAVRKAAEDVARLEALRQEGLALEAAEAARRAEEERLEYERKLDRDARYAARKERKKKAKSAFERFR